MMIGIRSSCNDRLNKCLEGQICNNHNNVLYIASDVVVPW